MRYPAILGTSTTRTSGAFVLGAITGAVVVWLWGREIEGYVGENSSTGRPADPGRAPIDPTPPWEAFMSRRQVTHLGAERSRRSASGKIAPAHRFEVDVDRQKRIDHHVDEIGTGGTRRRVATTDPCGESWLDANGVR